MYSTVFAAALAASPMLSPIGVAPLTGPSTPAAGETEISVLTYNVHGLPWPLTRNRAAMMRAIGRELGRLRAEGRQPDVVLIQEGFGADMGELVRLSGYRYWVKGPGRHDRTAGAPVDAGGYRPGRYVLAGEGWGKLTGSGLHVLSDAPILETRAIAYRYCAGFDCLANKGAMLVRIALPGGGEVEVVNTHMNSREAAHTPFARSLKAHNLQADELAAFVAAERDAAPMLIGGDFNVRGAPDRYYHRIAERPFTVVSEFCSAEGAACEGEAPAQGSEPWLKSEDLQAFTSRGGARVRPVRIETLFGSPAVGRRLSDHDGYLVRYRLGFAPSGPALPAVRTASAAP